MRVWLIVALTLITVIGAVGAYSAAVGPPQTLQWSSEAKQNPQEMNSRGVCTVALCRHDTAAAVKNHGSVVFYRRLLGHLGEPRLGSRRAAPAAMGGSTQPDARVGPLEVSSDNDGSSRECDVGAQSTDTRGPPCKGGDPSVQGRTPGEVAGLKRTERGDSLRVRRRAPLLAARCAAKKASFATAFS